MAQFQQYYQMINLLSVFEATLVCLLFTISIVFCESLIKAKKLDRRVHQQKFSKSKIKIIVMSLTVAVLMIFTYAKHCYSQIGVLECFYISPNHELARNIAIAFFINTTLFLGGIHQELYNGKIKKKIMSFYKRQFQWDLFKKLFIVPVYLQIVYRAIFCRIIDPNMQHPSFFTFLCGFVYGFSFLINIFEFIDKYDFQFALKTSTIQLIYNLIFGMYVSHIFSKNLTLISSIALQVYANFMGFPQYFQILKGGQSSDDRVRKSTIFYLFGVVGCLSCCLFL